MENIDRGQPRADRRKLESPLEETFIQNLEKYLQPNSEVCPQDEICTITGAYRLDFVVELNGKKVGFEFDGKEYHDVYRDKWRDARILNTGKIDLIYRFRGKGIFAFIDDCIYVIYKNDPWLFNNRYSHFCEKLVSKSSIEHFLIDELCFRSHEDIFLAIAINDEFEKNVGMMSLHVIRRSKGFDGHWKILASFAMNNPAKTLDERISLYKE